MDTPTKNSIIVDKLCDKYPNHTILLDEFIRTNLKTRTPAVRLMPPCPRNHTDKIDRKPVIVEGSKKGIYECKICGLFEVSEE